MTERDDEYFNDAVYWTWRSGGNPDLVDRDIADDAEARGIEVDDFVRSELRRQRRPQSDEKREE